jgi:hypothetical protein
VLVVGISDRSRRFHLVAHYVMSQETQSLFQAALLALRRLYSWMAEKHLVVPFAMADGDRAQFNRVRRQRALPLPDVLLSRDEAHPGAN